MSHQTTLYLHGYRQPNPYPGRYGAWAAVDIDPGRNRGSEERSLKRVVAGQGLSYFQRNQFLPSRRTAEKQETTTIG